MSALHHRMVFHQQFQQHSMKLYEVFCRLHSQGLSACSPFASYYIKQSGPVLLWSGAAARYHSGVGGNHNGVSLKGAWLILPHVGGLFLQLSLWQLVESSGPLPKAVMLILLFFSLLSWAVMFSKWAVFRRARSANRAFLRAFRKAPTLEAIAMTSEQFRKSPLVTVFDFGYSEGVGQMKAG